MNKNILKNLTEGSLEVVAARFRALGESSRLLLLKALHNGEQNVTELVKLTGLSQPNVSRHLSILVNTGLVGRRKEGLNVVYGIIDDSIADLCAIVCKSVSSPARTK